MPPKASDVTSFLFKKQKFQNKHFSLTFFEITKSKSTGCKHFQTVSQTKQKDRKEKRMREKKLRNRNANHIKYVVK